MKSITKITSSLILGLLIVGLSSCSKDDDPIAEVKADLTVNKVSDLNGSAGVVYYNLALNKQVQATETWDLSFTGTTIATSGTFQLVDGVFSSYTTAPASGYAQANIAGSGSWYTYSPTTPPLHIIVPTPGKVIVVKTTGGKYAKVEMLSYYKGNPAIKATSSALTDAEFSQANAKYYTFQFAIQADGTTNLK